jgi:flagellar protein FliS
MYNGSNVYQQVAVQTSSPEKLIVMLYEGAIRFLRESIEAIESKDLDRKRQSVDRAVAIVQHLAGTLDMEKGGPLAADLYRLYGYMMSRILDGSAKLETAPLEEVIKLLGVVLSGWEELTKKAHQSAVSPDLLEQKIAGNNLELHV